MMPVPWKLWEGQIVDLNFPLRRYLGSTDQSAVFLTQAGDPEPRNAAIKLVIAPPQQHGELLDQWEHAAQLCHPNVLRIWRWGACQVNQLALNYVVTEFAEENLADVLAERPLNAAEAREMLGPLMEALAYIHAEGLVHGHLKPANIMAVGDQLKLSVDGMSHVGDLGGLPSRPSPYDPPELGDRGRSPIGDVWSFGMTLVEILTQRLPQNGPKQEMLLPETLPEEFAPLVRACLRPDPRRRAPLSEIMAMFREPRPRPEPMSVVQTPSEPPAARRRWLSLALVSAAAVAMAGIFAAPRLINRPPEPPAAVQNVVARETAKPEIRPAVETAVPEPANPAPAVTPPPTPAPVEVAPPPVSKAPASPVTARKMETRPDQVVHQTMPDITDQARRTIRGKVKVNVLASVDPSGKVSGAKVESENSRYFANLTLLATRKWEFAPSETASEWLLRFEFTTKSTDVHPAKVSR